MAATVDQRLEWRNVVPTLGTMKTISANCPSCGAPLEDLAVGVVECEHCGRPAPAWHGPKRCRCSRAGSGRRAPRGEAPDLPDVERLRGGTKSLQPELRDAPELLRARRAAAPAGRRDRVDASAAARPGCWRSFHVTARRAIRVGGTKSDGLRCHLRQVPHRSPLARATTGRCSGDDPGRTRVAASLPGEAPAAHQP